MQKDLASMLLGLIALGAVILFLGTSILSLVSAVFSIVFGILAIREGGKIWMTVIGFATSAFTLILVVLHLIAG